MNYNEYKCNEEELKYILDWYKRNEHPVTNISNGELFENFMYNVSVDEMIQLIHNGMFIEPIAYARSFEIREDLDLNWDKYPIDVRERIIKEDGNNTLFTDIAAEHGDREAMLRLIAKKDRTTDWVICVDKFLNDNEIIKKIIISRPWEENGYHEEYYECYILEKLPDNGREFFKLCIENSFGLDHVAKYTTSPEDLISIYIQTDDSITLSYIAENLQCPDEILDNLVTHTDPDVRGAVLQPIQSRGKYYKILASGDPDTDVYWKAKVSVFS